MLTDILASSQDRCDTRILKRDLPIKVCLPVNENQKDIFLKVE